MEVKKIEWSQLEVMHIRVTKEGDEGITHFKKTRHLKELLIKRKKFLNPPDHYVVFTALMKGATKCLETVGVSSFFDLCILTLFLIVLCHNKKKSSSD